MSDETQTPNSSSTNRNSVIGVQGSNYGTVNQFVTPPQDPRRRWILAIVVIAILTALAIGWWLTAQSLVRAFAPPSQAVTARATFRVLVANFAATDTQGSNAAKDIAQQLCGLINNENTTQSQLSGNSIHCDFVDTVVTDVQQAAQLADERHSDIVIYGRIEGGRWFVPELYSGTQLTGAEELYVNSPANDTDIGQFGPRVSVALAPGAIQRSYTDAQLRPRFAALVKFLFGLAQVKAGLYKLGMRHFEEASKIEKAWIDEFGQNNGKEVLYLWMGTALAKSTYYNLPDPPIDCPREFASIYSEEQSSLPSGFQCAKSAYEEARKLNSQYVRASIGLASIWYYQAQTLSSAGTLTDTCMAYQRAIKAYQEIDILDTKTTTALQRATVQYNLGLALLKATDARCGNYTELARKYLNLIVSKYNGDFKELEMREIAANAWYQIGLINRQDSSYEEAIKAFDKVIDISGSYKPDNDWWQDIRWTAFSQKGQTYYDLAKGNLSSEYYTESLQAYMNVTQAWEQYGYNSPIIAADAYFNIGLIYNEQSHFDEAVNILEKGRAIFERLKLTDPRVQPLIWYFYLELGDGYYHLKQFKQANVYYDRVIGYFDVGRPDLRETEKYILKISYCRKLAALHSDEAMLQANNLAQAVSSLAYMDGFEHSCPEITSH
jgi:tetratricopeptide (TPR) repeat protein